MTETDIVKEILASLCKKYIGIGLFYRRNTGAVEAAERFIKFGLPGMADISGIINGRAIEIEVKSTKGRQTQFQKNWQKAVERVGGIYILTHTVEDCLSQIESCLTCRTQVN